MNKLFFLIFIFVSIFSNTKSQEILSNTLVLVDFSDSYFRPDEKNRQMKVEKAVDETFRLIKKSFEFVPKNSLIQVLPINDLSMESPILCEIELAETNLIGEAVGDRGIVDEEELEIRLNLCKKIIFKQKMAGGTDITGALRKAVNLSNSQAMSDDYKTIIIISDYIEFRGGGSINFKGEDKLDVSNFKFLLVHSLDYQRGDFFIESKKYAKEFLNKLKSLGASKIFIVPESSRFSDKMLKKVF